MKKYPFTLVLLLLAFASATIAQPSIWTVSNRADVLKGDARSVSIDENGSMTAAPVFTELFRTGQPYIWSSVVDKSGNVILGSGGEGRVYSVSPGGQGKLLTDLAEMNVSALAVGGNGELFAGTSPDGKVYRIDASGTAVVYFDPGEKYIWSLAALPDGSLAVGTGDSGKVYRVRTAGASPANSLLFDTSESHIISLAADKAGSLYAGTDSNGLVLRFGSDGKPFAMLDSPLSEIHQVVVGPDGSLYVLAVGESAAAPATSATPKPAEPAPSSGKVSVEKSAPIAQPSPQKSKYDLRGAKSAIYHIVPNAGPLIIWSSPTVVGFSIHAHQTGRGVILGSSDKGRIYDIGNDGRETLVLQSDASQISTLVAHGSSLYATSSNQGSLFQIGPGLRPEGIYESSVLDAGSSSSWGNLWWRGSGAVRIETRSGNTAEPAETWSSWQPITGSGMRGAVQSPPGQYFQWRGILENGASPGILNEASLAFLTRNAAPEVTGITILPANVGLIANPVAPIDPNIELSGLDISIFGIISQPVQPRRVFQRGARSFQWTAEDRNGDKLVYDIYFKEVSDKEFRSLRVDVTETFFSLDGLSLADGRYQIKVVAKDTVSNPLRMALRGELTSDTFDIDNTQPAVTVEKQSRTSGENVQVTFLASDRGSYIQRAEYSVNGGEWRSVFPDDAIADGAEERYTLELPLVSPGEISVTLRVFDAVGNVGTGRGVMRR